jgi:hypothetical protein
MLLCCSCRFTSGSSRLKDCPAARQRYLLDYPSSVKSTRLGPWEHFQQTGLYNGLMWRSELCSSNGTDAIPEIAKDRPSSASSIWSMDTAPRFANDGPYVHGQSKAFQSAGNEPHGIAWWRVDLERNTSDPLVRIHARECCTSDFKHTLQLRIGDQPQIDAARVCATISPRYGTLHAPAGVTDGGIFDARCMGSGRFVFAATEPDFLYMSTPKTWADAQSTCQQLSRELASIHSEADLAVVTSMVSPGVAAWIGLNDLRPQQSPGSDCGCNGDCFSWSDGSHNDFTWWNTGQPDEYGLDGLRHCSDASTHSGGRGHLQNCVVLEKPASRQVARDGFSPPYGFSPDSVTPLLGSDTTCSYTFPFVCGPVHATSATQPMVTQRLSLAEVQVFDDHMDTCYECHGHARVAVDAAYVLYVNGVEIGKGDMWSYTNSHSFVAHCNGTTTYAIAGASTSGKPAILAEIVHCGQVVRSSSSWRCASVNVSHLLPSDSAWAMPNFTEGNVWQMPIDGGKNGVTPWGARKGISAHASWLWSADSGDQSGIRCRLTLSHPVPDCEASRRQYVADYPAIRHSAVPPFTHFINHGRQDGMLWHGELCSQQCGGAYIVGLAGHGAFLQQRLQRLRPFAKYRLKFLIAGGSSPARMPGNVALYPSAVAIIDGVVVWRSGTLDSAFNEYSATFATVGTTTVLVRFQNVATDRISTQHLHPSSVVFVDEVAVDEISLYSDYDDHCTGTAGACSSAPCKNIAVGCRDSGTDVYSCTCSAGWSGENCEADVDECLSNPCANGGSCTDYVHAYACSCASFSGWAGVDCKISVDPCSSSPCLHNSTCVESVGSNGRLCVCQDGWTGTTCERNLDECASMPCAAGSTCIDKINSYSCHCSSGWTGNNCNAPSTPCALHEGEDCDPRAAVCQHIGPGSHICNCFPGYAAQSSSCVDIDNCAASQCTNGATCIDAVGYYTCSCVSGYTGGYCTTRVDACTVHPCEHGVCQTRNDGSFSCVCLTGWSGAHCSVNDNDCLSFPCLHSVRCVDGINDYSCICSPGWIGKRCDENIAECATSSCASYHANNRTCVQYRAVTSPPHARSPIINSNFSDRPQLCGLPPIGWAQERGVLVCNSSIDEWGGVTAGSGSSYAALVGAGAFLSQTMAGLKRGREYVVTIRAARHPEDLNQTMRIFLNGRCVRVVDQLGVTFNTVEVPFRAIAPTVLLRIESSAGVQPVVCNATAVNGTVSLTVRGQTCQYQRNTSVFIDSLRFFAIVPDSTSPVAVMNEGFEADDDVSEMVCTQSWTSQHCQFRYITPQGWQGSFRSTIVLTQGNAVWGGVNSALSQSCVGWTPSDGTAHISADSSFKLYVNGNRVGSGEDWRVTQALSFWASCSESTTYAIEGMDNDVGGTSMASPAPDLGALTASISHCGENHPTNQKWKCSADSMVGQDLSWTQAGFDDSNWSPATDYGANGAWGPWTRGRNGKAISQVSPVARWIWTTNYSEVNHVFCRLESRHQSADCQQARTQYWNDYPDVAADGNFNGRDGAYEHYVEHGRQERRVWHSELCEVETVAIVPPPCPDPMGSMSAALIALVGPGEYGLCPGRSWHVPGFESFGPVTCFNEDLCRAVGSSCAGMLRSMRHSSTCEEQFDCAAFEWDAGECAYNPDVWTQYSGTVTAVASSTFGDGQVEPGMDISNSIHPRSHVFRMTTDTPQHYQVVLRFAPPAPVVNGIAIMVLYDSAASTGFSGLEVGTVSAGSGTVRQQIVRHEMFGSYLRDARWQRNARDFHFNEWTTFTFARGECPVYCVSIVSCSCY